MYLGKEVKVILKDQAKERYLMLRRRTDDEAKTILASITRVVNILKENPQYGNPVRKRLIPQRLRKLGITNLYRAELSNYWRMLYTLEGHKIAIYVFVLTITDHEEYDKIFGYRS